MTLKDIAAAISDVLLIKPSYKDRFVIFGRDKSGRILAIVVGEVPENPDVYQVFSARPANRRERRDLRQDPEP